VARRQRPQMRNPVRSEPATLCEDAALKPCVGSEGRYRPEGQLHHEMNICDCKRSKLAIFGQTWQSGAGVLTDAQIKGETRKMVEGGWKKIILAILIAFSAIGQSICQAQELLKALEPGTGYSRLKQWAIEHKLVFENFTRDSLVISGSFRESDDSSAYAIHIVSRFCAGDDYAGKAYNTTLQQFAECDYMTGMDKKRELRTHWQRVCKLILAKEDVLTVSRALELALFMDAKLDVSRL
jgi:hypothetical protein